MSRSWLMVGMGMMMLWSWNSQMKNRVFSRWMSLRWMTLIRMKTLMPKLRILLNTCWIRKHLSSGHKECPARIHSTNLLPVQSKFQMSAHQSVRKGPGQSFLRSSWISSNKILISCLMQTQPTCSRTALTSTRATTWWVRPMRKARISIMIMK